MGTGTPTVSTEGLSAANAILKKVGREPYVYKRGMKDYVRLVSKPFQSEQLFDIYPAEDQVIMREALRCRLCERPSCAGREEADIRGIMRRTAVGNFAGARKRPLPADAEVLLQFEKRCIMALEGGQPVAIRKVASFLAGNTI